MNKLPEIFNRKCCRPTKSGQPCKNRPRSVFYIACDKHITNEEINYAAQLQAWNTWRWPIEPKPNKQEETTKLRPATKRSRDEEGRQLVTVNNKLGYAWIGSEDLQIGDKVVVPPFYWQQENQYGVVTAIESTYVGRHIQILRKV